MMFVGFLLMICLVVMWVFGNIVMKKVGCVNFVLFVVWVSFVLLVLFFLLLLWFEGL